MTRTMREVLYDYGKCSLHSYPAEVVDYFYRVRNEMPLTESQETFKEILRLHWSGKDIPEALLNQEFKRS